MPASLIDVLAEIDARGPHLAPAPHAADARNEPAPPRPEIASAFAPRGISVEEVEARLAEAVAAATAASRAEAEARFSEALERRLAEVRADAETALGDARAAWAREEGDRLAERVRDGLAGIEERIAEAAARALAPLLAAAARDRALATLAASVATLLRADPALVLVASGPADLGEALVARLGDAAQAVRFTPADTPDLVVEGEDVVIETRLSDWARRIAADVP
ncbi:MAG: hypothetical protein ACFE0R_12740 [Salinarimonas sp.]